MFLTEMEWISLLKKERMTDLQIAAAIDCDEKTVRSIKKGHKRKATAFAGRLGSLGAEYINLPWSDDADAQVKKMFSLISEKKWSDIYHMYAFSTRLSVVHTLKLDPNSRVVAEDWGHALIAYSFLLGMQLSKNSVHRHYGDKGDWPAILDVVQNLLTKRKETWATLLGFKVASNRVVIAWQQANPRESRSSPEMRNLIEESGYREHLVAYNDLVPHEATAPFNALAIASRFGDQAQYEDLFDRLQKSDSKCLNVKKILDPDFDDDFDDFRKWYTSCQEAA